MTTPTTRRAPSRKVRRTQSDAPSRSMWRPHRAVRLGLGSTTATSSTDSSAGAASLSVTNSSTGSSATTSSATAHRQGSSATGSSAAVGDCRHSDDSTGLAEVVEVLGTLRTRASRSTGSATIASTAPAAPGDTDLFELATAIARAHWPTRLPITSSGPRRMFLASATPPDQRQDQ